jgi:hypothetical protein
MELSSGVSANGNNQYDIVMVHWRYILYILLKDTFESKSRSGGMAQVVERLSSKCEA